jgi:hypothetical protein
MEYPPMYPNPTTRYEQLWSRYEADCRSLTPAELEEMEGLSPYRRADRDGCPDCGRMEHSCHCGYFAALEREEER